MAEIKAQMKSTGQYQIKVFAMLKIKYLHLK